MTNNYRVVKIRMLLDASTLTAVALDLSSGLSPQDRYRKLLDTINQLLDCDACALLLFNNDQFKPLAINGLCEQVLAKVFYIAQHPRLEIIARAGDVVRFPADSDLPDPYDDLIPNQHSLKVHSCIGLPLMANGVLIGALTIDGFKPGMFDQISDAELRTLSALAAASLNNALIMQQLESHTGQVNVNDQGPNLTTDMIGSSPQLKSLQREIKIAAGSELHVLILGETGVGKELVAQQIHQLSPRHSGPQVYLNCAALPESVAESELFGHVKGAFTGAISHRKGKFETANHGTLFLDEIGELSPAIQAKLLRVIQYGDIQRIGDDRNLKVSVRIVAATNKDLKKEVLEGRFRADLFHRLSVFPLIVPPLREREGDIPLLAAFFVEKSRQQLGLQTLILRADALELLQQYHWPGNVRELEHSIYRASIIAKADLAISMQGECTLTTQHFNLAVNVSLQPPHRPVLKVDNQLSLHQATLDFQRQLIQGRLQKSKGNWAHTARSLHLDGGNLHRLAKRLGLK